ncbi:Hop family outer membrane protein HopF [Helicobacter pylori]|uniref:Hop family outer membrane protein HopF n=1 Tax=Helicobacter pylori TaxID=210 RepID=UPI000980F91B|nr:Hop family outer membrane protein HopF [Helicobacter pylori]KAF1000381.1 Outer membrane protein HopF [Helicobacter pylori 10700]AQM65290.1 outer membrane protein [Helicobacter pylori SS1]AQM71741.1 outer membrane protein [Helicobacter pylori PMSS1]KAF0999122.1 Outer membrane protein HopF [Helicobacter pylori SS1_190]KAF0999904.1 Outer membrane protein HopF [Helicobacter pylori SS1]
MKNHSFKKTIALSLLASMSLCNAEEDGAFFVIDYQTSLARQELKNPGFTQAQGLKQLIRDGAVRLQTSAIPLSYYLDILGNKTKILLSESLKNSSQVQPSQPNGQSTPNPALANLEQSLGILGKLLDLSQQYASEGVIKPLVVDVGKEQIGITDSMLLVAQNIVLALGQVDLSKIQQNNNEQLYENIMKVMLLGAGGTNGAYNGVSVGDIATGMQNFSSQTGLIGANSTVSELNALIKSGISLDRETLRLGSFIEKNICSSASPCFTGSQLVYRKGLDRVINIINASLGQFESSASSLYKISYIPNLFSLKDYQSASMNGFGAKMGYKQFFTHKKNIGLRYYGFLDYGYANFGDTNLKVGANLVTYGVGTDFLYNVYERSRRRERTTIGLFFGAQIAGQTWSTNVTNLLSGQRPDVKSSSFQFLFDLGVRTNFAKTNFNKHRLDQGIEFGVKIPVIAHKYFATQGSSASYMRNFSFYVGYSVGF